MYSVLIIFFSGIYCGRRDVLGWRNKGNKPNKSTEATDNVQLLGVVEQLPGDIDQLHGVVDGVSNVQLNWVDLYWIF